MTGVNCFLCRLMCTVCKRDFRSLPALNGHMRSHSGSRPAAWLNKVRNYINDSKLYHEKTEVNDLTVVVYLEGTSW